MGFKSCPKCGASFIEGQLFWSTGKPGKEEDLAGLVCNQLEEEDVPLCINEKRGATGGDTWEYRRGYIDGAMAELSRNKEEDDYPNF